MYNKKTVGKLFYNYSNKRMDVAFNDGSTDGGLHCGQYLDVKIKGQWTPTRIEMSDDWYLVGIKVNDLEGLTVRL